MQWCSSILCQVHTLCAAQDETAVSSCTAHSIYITMYLTQYAATPLHVPNDVFYSNIFNKCNFS